MLGKSANQVPVFHHLPKCGGTSVLKMLASWYRPVHDYRQNWTSSYQNRLNLDYLTPGQCLCGHFELDGYHLAQRYPGLLENPRFWVFSFIRDPLEVKMSLFRYEAKNNVTKPRTIEKHLSTRKNYLANVLGVGWDDFKTVLDKYAFIGVLEESALSFEMLAWLLKKNKTELPWENKTLGGEERSQDALPSLIVQQFKEENGLDYAIYNYAVERFKKLNGPYQNHLLQSGIE
jgi:hypothetical protein